MLDVLPNGSRISGEQLLEGFGEVTAAGAKPHEPPASRLLWPALRK